MTYMTRLAAGVLAAVILAGAGAASAAPAARGAKGLVGCGFNSDCLKKCSQGYGILYPICVITSPTPPDAEQGAE